MYCRWVRDASRPFSQGSRGGAGLAPARISQSHSYRCHSDRGYAAEPAITAVGAAKAAASGSLSWRAHDQEEHIRPTVRTRSHRALSDIEAVCSSEAEVREQIRLTVIHELGHYFGLDENQLKDV